MRIIDSEEALADGLAALAKQDPAMRRLIREGARPPLRKREPGFAGLAWMVVSQQLSTSSAQAIWGRLSAAFPALSPAMLAAVDDPALQALGLSRPKIRALRAIADAVLAGSLPLDTLHDVAADEAHRAMVAVTGIGPWTADLYLLFCLGHPDAFPAGDLALQESARIAFGWPARPKEKDFIAFAERWRPWRGIAASVLWAHYRMAKFREGAPVG